MAYNLRRNNLATTVGPSSPDLAHREFISMSDALPHPPSPVSSQAASDTTVKVPFVPLDVKYEAETTKPVNTENTAEDEFAGLDVRQMLAVIGKKMASSAQTSFEVMRKTEDFMNITTELSSRLYALEMRLLPASPQLLAAPNEVPFGTTKAIPKYEAKYEATTKPVYTYPNTRDATVKPEIVQQSLSDPVYQPPSYIPRLRRQYETSWYLTRINIFGHRT
ncbi:hypothetical protein EMMF5_006618 [Cystobasidiomycetes sp. EMM_F5]